jgi:hypothetical protein
MYEGSCKLLAVWDNNGKFFGGNIDNKNKLFVSHNLFFIIARK